MGSAAATEPHDNYLLRAHTMCLPSHSLHHSWLLFQSITEANPVSGTVKTQLTPARCVRIADEPGQANSLDHSFLPQAQREGAEGVPVSLEPNGDSGVLTVLPREEGARCRGLRPWPTRAGA